MCSTHVRITISILLKDCTRFRDALASQVRFDLSRLAHSSVRRVDCVILDDEIRRIRTRGRNRDRNTLDLPASFS